MILVPTKWFDYSQVYVSPEAMKDLGQLGTFEQETDIKRIASTEYNNENTTFLE